MNFRLLPPFALPALMLGVPLLGSLASMARGVLLGSEDCMNLLVVAALLLLPVAVMVSLCIWVSQRNKGAAWGAGLMVVIVATGVNFYLLMPEHFRDASMPISLYVLLGWLFPLLPAALLGGMMGAALWRGPTQVKSPTLPLVPWLWPLLIPLFSVVSMTVFHALTRAANPFSFESMLYPILIVLGLLLGLILLPLVLLRQQAERTRQLQPHLSAWWGVCAGLASAMAVAEFWSRTGFGLLFVLGLVLPFVGYGLGLLWGERQSRLAARQAPTHPNG
ncbi:hypothetical protein [Deinococcus puniceus]|uniref:Uncharacterized protein n=1 Tax=Deinococcus puniceus TaxID=1182568 RepID=A0A172T7Y3_9DEIO|nr:hypothetical protein [Deinococcus puniceus]ANE43057.1 hypothetical protein SU48_03945 [Deinococcus puniceus]